MNGLADSGQNSTPGVNAGTVKAVDVLSGTGIAWASVTVAPGCFEKPAPRVLRVGVEELCIARVVPEPTLAASGVFKRAWLRAICYDEFLRLSVAPALPVVEVKPVPGAPCVGVKALRVALVAPYLAPAASGCYIRLWPETALGSFG